MTAAAAARRALGVAGLVAAVAVAACSGSTPDGATSATTVSAPTSTPTEAEASFSVTELADGGAVVATAAFELAVSGSPVTLRATAVAAADPDGADEPFFAAEALHLVRAGERTVVESVTLVDPGLDHVTLDVAFDDGATGHVEIAGGTSDRTLAVRVWADDPSGVTHWGSVLAAGDEELIYGLTERIVDHPLPSEVVPEEVGSLDRMGEMVTMYVTPTMSGYVPFHQSSAGYGLLVDGFMPGTYDLGATDPSEIVLEFELDPDALAGTFHLFRGPDHPTILEEYYGVAGSPHQPPDLVFVHWRGRDELPVGDPVDVDGVALNASVAGDLAAYDEYGIPAGIYHYDRPWAVGQEGYGDLVFDPERFPDPEGMLALLDARGWHQVVWMSPWAIGARGAEAEAAGYLVPGTRAIDLTDPAAVAWLGDDLVEFLEGPEGRYIDGFFMDRGDEGDVLSTADDVYADGRNGRQIHNWYPVEYQRVFSEAMTRANPDEGFLISRPGYTGSQAYVMRWGGDTHSREGLAIPEAPIETAPSTDLGLRSVLISVQRAAFMGTPYWGSDIGGYTAWVDREVYARWIQVGFASPLMRFHGQGGTPWETTTGGFDEGLVEIYKGYVELRHDLVPYLAEASAEASATGNTMVRPLVFAWPDEPEALDRWDEWLLGPDLLVAPVWESGARAREVWLPPGEWIDWWTGTAVTGPETIEVEVPLGVLPMWVRPGSPLLDLEVPASLTAVG